jgi:hypothetical protein
MNIMEPGPPHEISDTHHTVYMHVFEDSEEVKQLISNLYKMLKEIGDL